MTDAPMIPKPEQAAAIARIVAEPTHSALIAAQTGSGKTLVAVEVMKELALERVVISAPIHTHDGWRATLERQIPDAQVFVVNNKNKAGKEGLARLKWGLPGFYLISREFWRLQNWKDVQVDAIIHDECHTLANRGNAGSRLARRVAKGWMACDWTILMSATPFGSNFGGAWSIGRILWPELIDRVPLRWEDEWCETKYDPHAARAKRDAIARGVPGADKMNVAKVVGEKDPGQFVRSLPCYIYFEGDKREKPLVIPIRVDLSRAQRKVYDEFEEKGLAWLGENPLVAEVPIVQRIRLRQITLAECSFEDTGALDEFGDPKPSIAFAEDAKSTKLETLQELLADEAQGQKVLIATDSAKFARVVAKRIGGFAWTGMATEKERAAAKQAFISGDLNYIVATQASISEGLDGLQHGSHIMVILSENDSDMLNTQMLGRLNRRGQENRVIVYKIVANNTYDDPQAKTLLMKTTLMRKALYVKSEVAA